MKEEKCKHIIGIFLFSSSIPSCTLFRVQVLENSLALLAEGWQCSLQWLRRRTVSWLLGYGEPHDISVMTLPGIIFLGVPKRKEKEIPLLIINISFGTIQG